jgi:hypothetical protein
MHLDSDGTFRDTAIASSSPTTPLGLDIGASNAHPTMASSDGARTTTSICSYSLDWRRRLDETVTFFVTKFLPYFQFYVRSECQPPIDRFRARGSQLWRHDREPHLCRTCPNRQKH